VNPVVRYTLVALAAASLAFGVTHFCLRQSTDTDEMAWMRSEFHLNDTQVAAIEKLHDDYEPVCMTHCAAIMTARKQLDAASPSEKPAVEASLIRLQAVCHDATLAHLQRVAALMPPDQAARFLALVGPKVSGQSHDAPLGLK
jgi:hypothetical protein